MDLVEVVMEKHTEVYNVGEVVSFPAEKAARLIAAGSAMKHTPAAAVTYGKPKGDSKGDGR